MAYTSATRVLGNPRFLVTFDVERRQENINNKGISKPKSVKYPRVRGSVQANGADLIRTEDQQHMPKSLSIVTRFKLQGPAPGFQPDLIDYRGSHYVITHVDDYTEWGSGWVQAIAESTDTIDVPPGNHEC